MRNAVFSSDGRWVLTACDDGEVRLWDAGTGELLTTLKVQAAPLRWVDVSQDGQWVLTAESDRAVIYPWEKIAPVADLVLRAQDRLPSQVVDPDWQFPIGQ